jgi:hypothetical protein
MMRMNPENHQQRHHHHDRDLSSSVYSHSHHSNRSHYEEPIYYGNYSITTSVTMRVTPHTDYMLSWAVLWGCFVMASAAAAVQSCREQRVLSDRRKVDDVENTPSRTDGEGVSSADATRGLVCV